MKKITLLILFLSTLWGYSQVKNYKFSQTTAAYTEITGGTVLGDESSDAQRFVDVAVPLGGLTTTGVGLPIGFNFTFNGYVYDRFAVSTDGWISLGASALSPTQVDCTVANPALPLSSTTAVTANLASRISALGMDLMAQTGASISYKTIGTAPNRILVVQWKGFKKGTTLGAGDNFNFQIKLEETTNKVSIAYGSFICNSTYISNSVTPIPTAQVGLRADPATAGSNFVNRASSAGWNNTTAGAVFTDNIILNGTTVPSSGLVYSWAAPICDASTSIYEDFDNYSGNFTLKQLPDCWSKIVSGSADAYVTTGAVSPLSAPSRLNLASGSSAAPIYAILPALSNLPVGVTATHRLRFKAFATTTNTTLEVGYMTDSSNAATFVLIKGVTLTNVASATPFIVSPTDIPSTATNLVFRNRGNTTGGGLTIYIDDVTWEPIPACADISSLVAKGFTSNSVNLSWTKGGSETNWEYAYGPASALNPNEQTILDVTSTVNGTTVTTTINGLSAATSYKIWVRAKCTNGAWMGPVVFSTTPAPVAQVMENFDESLNLPTGWTKVPGSPGTVTMGFTNYYPNSNPNYLSLNATSGKYSMVSLPPISNVGAGTHRLKFKMRGFVTNTSVEIGYLDDISDASTFHAFAGATVTNPLTYTFVDIPVITLGTQPLTITNLVLKNPATVTNGHVYIDNVSWEKDTSISCPDVTDLSVTALTSTAVSLGWSRGTNGTENAWQYAIGSKGIPNPFSLTPVDVTSLTPTIANLTPATSYRVWVRSNCTNGSFGAWIGPLDFTTPCPSGDAFSQNFNVSNTTPGCWCRATGNAIITANGLAIYGSTLQGYASGIWALPPVKNVGAGNYRVKFVYRFVNTTSGPLELGYMTNMADPTTFTQIKALTGTNTAYSPETIVELGQFSGSEIVAFRYKGTNSGITNAYVDDVVVEQIPLCGDVSNIKVVAVTSNTVGLDWDNVQEQDKWQYAVETSLATTANGLSATDVLTVSETIVENLAPDTNYKVWVRAKCGTNGVGSWIGPVEFKTLCANVGSISETFEGTSLNQLPACWTKVGNGGELKVGNYTIAGGKAIAMGPTQISGNYTIDNPLVIAIPPISNAGAGDYVLKFKYAAANVNAAIEVGYVTNILDPLSFTPISDGRIEIVDKEVLQNAVVRVNNPLANVLAFKNASVTPIYVFLDDVSWEPASTAAPECATNVTAVTNTNCGNFATLISWSPVADADGYKLSIGTTPTGHDILDGKPVYKLDYSFLGDVEKTYYYSVTPFNIIGDATECGTKNFTTGTNGCYCISVPSSKSGKGISNVTLGGTNFSGGNGTYANYTTKLVNLNKDEKANLKLTFDTRVDGHGPFYYTKVWVDFNNDFVFDSSELTFSKTSGITDDGPVTLDASFDIPADAALGLYTVRIVAGHLSEVDVNPCYNGSNAVTLDLKINLMSASTLAVNDASSAPVSLTVGKTFAEYSIIGTNVNTTGSVIETEPACGNYNGSDVWYKAVVPESGKLTFEVNSIVGGITNTAAAAYVLTDDSLTLVECNDSGSTVGDDHPKINLVRPAGETIYFRLWENGGDAFGDCAVSAYESATLGMDSFDIANFTYYPNPVKDILNIALEQEISDVVVMNLLGQKVITSRSIGTVKANQTKINMSELSKGTYLVKVTSGNQSRTIKAVKE